MAEQTINFDSNPPVATNEYDTMIQMALPGYEVMHNMTLSVLRASLPEKANLLIVGAGSGMELVKFGKSNSQWQMLGVDPSSNMLSIAQNKIEEYGLSAQIKLFAGYTHDLDPNSFYDAATCILVMHFLPDDGSKLALLQNISQRLKSSGTFILVDIFGEKGTQEFERMIAIIKVYWEQMGITPTKITEGLETIKKGVFPIPEIRVVELLQQAGFCNILRFYTGLWVGGWVATKNS
ncbi:class I SAM-dependent methyltransferase [Anabaena cylindrica FACHB-243]|uniref:Methyltransferase type 12 n=1 Tax=Anabaena cylindrica (strain ATCC 27899 / PCC 7122) TaxID=272123 RepID=K9ZB85_ANACC|nr:MULTISPECIES: methyltransferase [Anabaena]AFZ55852.1 Methyltransferase type 12 [Anabaena cylindrica PCC 7122]MBD2421274.1 class I SAM-dependent methyltransferase [Anabaena cylindrica FACHB-243]MBY5285195.1 class I SAM-dependent methyltransferase [Anabaena sp. CCAP 1446/1C]MBY5306615.1 class I SAM-dependent methyltransferase [Anabaena sp. CCAP 1446/1C]MCM2406605.1 class I SAM-dependent methyltransferase [Anabaena sp. CCAP 1446/1C]